MERGRCVAQVGRDRTATEIASLISVLRAVAAACSRQRPMRGRATQATQAATGLRGLRPTDRYGKVPQIPCAAIIAPIDGWCTDCGDSNCWLQTRIWHVTADDEEKEADGEDKETDAAGRGRGL